MITVVFNKESRYPFPFLYCTHIEGVLYVKKTALTTLTLALTLTSLSAQKTMAAKATDQTQPNILFIAADDMKPLVGCYDDSYAVTPHLDALGESGTVFLNAHCQYAVCGPSRASLMTSMMPEVTGVIGFKQMRAKLPDLITLPQHFRENGYETAACGKINDPRCVEGGRNTDDPPSWSIRYQYGVSDAYKPPQKRSSSDPDIKDDRHEDGQICNKGLQLMEQLSKEDKPFFLAVGFKKPHLPFIAPKKYWDLYDREEIPIAAWQELPINGLQHTWNGGKETRGYPDVPNHGPIPEDKQRELIHGYYACVSFIDAQVGRLLNKLEDLGLSENTIVVFWGDHGFHLGDHGEWGKHTNMEHATRVPLIISDPRAEAVGTPPSPAGFIDLYPTLCELAGLEIPEQVQGKSLVPMMKDESASVRNGAISLFRRAGKLGYAYRTKRYRYIEWYSGSGLHSRELYDYEEDPNETRNLAADEEYHSLMKDLSEQLKEEGIGCTRLLSL
jgi:arylsulfatase A-like enzyme